MVIEFTFTPEKIGIGKHKEKLALINTMQFFYRYGFTRIKNSFKNRMKEWYVPLYDGPPFTEAKFEYTILRHNNRNIDSDSIAGLYTKWLQDVFVEQEYLVDDNRTTVVLNPAQMNTEHMETRIYVKITLSGEVKMDIDEMIGLIREADKLVTQLFEQGNYKKSDSKKLRKIMVEIKKGVPSFRQALIEEDKNHSRGNA